MRSSKKLARFYEELKKLARFLLILVSSITGCVYISVFASLVGISVCIVSYAVEKTFCAVTTVIKKYKSMIKKRKKKHDKIPVEKSKISQKP